MKNRIGSWTSSAARFANVTLAASLTKLVEQIERCADKPGVDEVHDLRVSIRKFSQSLRVFASLLSAKPVKSIRKALRPVMEAAGCVRDLDVGMDRLLDDGLEENSVVLEEMRIERRRGEMALRGRLLLLKSKEPGGSWPAQVHIQTSTAKKPESNKR